MKLQRKERTKILRFRGLEVLMELIVRLGELRRKGSGRGWSKWLKKTRSLMKRLSYSQTNYSRRKDPQMTRRKSSSTVKRKVFLHISRLKIAQRTSISRIQQIDSSIIHKLTWVVREPKLLIVAPRNLSFQEVSLKKETEETAKTFLKSKSHLIQIAHPSVLWRTQIC